VIERIVSGGQTGVDRAALDFAMAQGIPHGGFCPRGRRSESGPIPARYRLVETATAVYAERTLLNLQHSDGTLVITRGAATGGTKRTIEGCRDAGKPCLVVDLEEELQPAAFAAWVHANGIRTLNVAGPRESTRPGIGRAAAAAPARLLEALPAA
jgi:hypothetical protein